MHDHYAREFARSPAGARRLAVALASGTGRSRENKRDSRRFRFSERWQHTIGRLIFYLPAAPLRIGVTFAFTPFSRLMVGFRAIQWRPSRARRCRWPEPCF